MMTSSIAVPGRPERSTAARIASAAAIAAHVRQLAIRMGGRQVATVGSLELHPNLVNVVAGSATMTVDLRNPDEALLGEAEADLARFVAEAAAAREAGVPEAFP